jgi:hypothetical protein
MTDYDNTNSGALFKNDKEGNEKRPDYKGPLNVDGQEYYISAWLKTSKIGQKFMSLQVTPAQKKSEDFDDDVPAAFDSDSALPF